MSKKNPQYESMRKLTIGRFNVRVWVTESELGSQENAEDVVNNGLAGVIVRNPEIEDLEIKGILRVISEYDDRIAAVEVLDSKGNGALVYPDWK